MKIRLALINGLILLAVLIVLGVVIRSATKSILVGRVDQGLDRQVTAVQRMYGQILIDPAHAAERREAAERVVTNIEQNLRSLPGSGGKPGRAGYWPIRVLDLNGKAFLRAYARIQGVDEPWDRETFNKALNGQSTRIDYHDSQGEPIRLRSEPIVVGGKPLAIVQGSAPLTEAYAILDRLDSVLLEIIPVAVLLSIGLGWLLAAISLRPARELAKSIADVDSENLALRIPVNRKDEIGVIGEGFNEMLERLEEAFALVEASKEKQRQFSADISHELRNPLTVVATNVSFALNDDKLPAETRRALESTLRASRSMARLVEDLLLIARADSAPPTEGDSIVDLTSIVGLLAEQMRREDLAPIKLQSSAPIFAHGDPDHLERIFRNLIENALNHTPATGSVTVGMEAEDGWVRIVVEDTGTGIPAEFLDRVRERFFRVDPSRTRSKGGTGLGLTICDSLVKASGGRLVLESEVEKGTRATVFLPAFKLDEAQSSAAL